MDVNFELIKYPFENYNVFRLELPEDAERNPDRMGFAIVELKNEVLYCSKCGARTNTVQTWWHNKLPYSYINGSEEGLNVHLCLSCAAEENNNNIIRLRNGEIDDDNENREKLLNQFELENEQIESYKTHKGQQVIHN